jgi:osmotically-inducible protein OsmY
MGERPDDDTFLGAEAAGNPPGSSIMDELTRLEILNALHWDLAVPRDRVNVEVRGGRVTLTGVVYRTYSKGCAERDARAIAHVVDVANEILVAPSLTGNVPPRPA